MLIYELIEINGQTYKTRVSKGYRIMILENEWVILCSYKDELLVLVSGEGEEVTFINKEHTAPELDSYGWQKAFPEVNVTCMDERLEGRYSKK